MPGATTSSHVWTLTRSHARKSVQPKSWLREVAEGQSPNAHLWRFIWAPHCWFLPHFPGTGFPIHTRERKLVFPLSVFPAHVCKALWEENCLTPQLISIITLDPYEPWACCPPWDQQPSLSFPGKDYAAYQKTKLLTLFLKSLSSPQSQFLIYSWMNLKDRVTFARYKNVTGYSTAKPQALFFSSVCYKTLFSPSGHSGDGPPPSAYRLIDISDFFLMHLRM